jgi:hypothetical protein
MREFIAVSAEVDDSLCEESINETELEVQNSEPNNNIPQNNLVRISANEQYELYLKGLEASVEQFKQMYPEKYEKAQSIGDDMMNKKYELTIGEDLKGDLLKCKNILVTILQYGLEKSDLYENEFELLKKVLTCSLNIIHDINDIFENVEMIEELVSKITDKLTELENQY